MGHTHTLLNARKEIVNLRRAAKKQIAGYRLRLVTTMEEQELLDSLVLNKYSRISLSFKFYRSKMKLNF